MKGKKKLSKKIHAAALTLIRDPKFLFRIVQKVGELGIVGEKRNGLVFFLAAITKNLDRSVSVLEKGESSTGKSELVKAVIRLLPPESVLVRASLSKTAPVHGTEDLAGKILYIVEYRGARDAMYLTRLLQSEGEIRHEYAIAVGRHRGTRVASRKGSPVIFTTTTEERVFQDDETRFLSVQADDSVEQTQEVIRAHFSREPHESNSAEDLPVWQEANRILCKKIPEFRYPGWFEFLADQIPVDEPRARRDGVRFLSLLKAVTLCRSHSDGRFKKSSNEIEIDFADYCVGYRILSRAFASTFAGVDLKALTLAKVVRRLNKRLDQPATVKELVEELGWDQAVVYKYAKKAEKRNLVEYEPGTHPRNQKRLLPGLVVRQGFLPDPNLILQNCPELGDEVSYIDPLTGKEDNVTVNE
jgi:hypothetical protein